MFVIFAYMVRLEGSQLKTNAPLIENILGWGLVGCDEVGSWFWKGERWVWKCSLVIGREELVCIKEKYGIPKSLLLKASFLDEQHGQCLGAC